MVKLLVRLIVIGDNVVDDTYRATIPLKEFFKPVEASTKRRSDPGSFNPDCFNNTDSDSDVDATTPEKEIQGLSISSPEPVVDGASSENFLTRPL